eukprot:754660-Hanusia_phi.AAC.1
MHFTLTSFSFQLSLSSLPAAGPQFLPPSVLSRWLRGAGWRWGRACRMPLLHQRQTRRITVRLKVLRLLECPLDGRYLYVKVKWGQSVFGPKQQDKTEVSTCVHRSVEWRDTFEYEFPLDVDPVAIVQSMSDLEQLRKKHFSSCQLHLQVKVAKVC